MSAKRSRALRVSLETLERRDTPSGHTSALANTPAKSSKDLSTAGLAVVTFSRGIQEGQTVTTTLAGHSKALGRFRGELNVFYGLGQAPFGTGTGVIFTEDGDEIDLEVHSHIYNSSRQGGQNGVTTLKVTDGTGRFIGATGSGTLYGRVNTLYAYPFRLSLHVRG